MFDEREINAYRSIHAPQELRGKVMAQAARGSGKRRRTAALRPLYALAACLVLVAVIGSMRCSGGMEILLDGTPVMQSPVALMEEDQDAAVRMASIEPVAVELEVELSGVSQLSVSGGTLRVQEKEAQEFLPESEYCRAEGAVLVFWEIPDGDTACTYELTISGEKESAVILLSYDMAAGCWSVCRPEK